MGLQMYVNPYCQDFPKAPIIWTCNIGLLVLLKCATRHWSCDAPVSCPVPQQLGDLYRPVETQVCASLQTAIGSLGGRGEAGEMGIAT